jgi:hypothetical protein
MAYAFFKAGQPEIAGVLVDNRLSEEHKAEAEMTRFPIEGGSPDVSDHVILSPKEISITAWVSNIDGVGIPAVGERAKQVLIDLQKLRDDRERLDLVTYHVIYQNMVLVSVTGTHQNTATGALEVTCVFQQNNEVAVELLPIPAETVSEADENDDHGRGERSAATSEVDSGRKTSNDSSILYRVANNGIEVQ